MNDEDTRERIATKYGTVFEILNNIVMETNKLSGLEEKVLQTDHKLAHFNTTGQTVISKFQKLDN